MPSPRARRSSADRPPLRRQLRRGATALTASLGLVAMSALPAFALIPEVGDQSVNGANRTTTTGNPATPSGGTGGTNYCQNVITPFGGSANNSSPTGFSGGGINWTITKNDGVPVQGGNPAQSDYQYNKNGTTPSGVQGNVTNFYQLAMDVAGPAPVAGAAQSDVTNPSATAGQYEDLILTADQPVSSLSFTVLDVDTRPPGGNYRDVVGVVGSATAGGTYDVTPAVSRVGSQVTSTLRGAEAVITGQANVGATQRNANATLTFATPITQVRIRYSSGTLPDTGNQGETDNGNGGATKQLIGISPFQYCGNSIGAAKSGSTPVRNGKAYTVNYTFTAENTGGGVLRNPQIYDITPQSSVPGTPVTADGLPARFGTRVTGTPTLPGTYSVGMPTITQNSTNPVALNPNFTGTTPNNQLLQPGSGTLGVNEKVTVVVPITFVPTAAQQTALNNGTANFDNSARVTANGVNNTSNTGTPDVEDYSATGTNVDPTGNGRANDDTSPTRVSITRAPDVTLVKSRVGTGNVSVGGLVTYNFLVTNTGNVPLTATTINDPKITGVVCPAGTLDIGESKTCTGTYRATAADSTAGRIVNTATATGTTAGTGTPRTVTSPPSTVTVTVNRPVPSISLTKTATSGTGPYVGGQTVTYGFTITNNGSTALTGVSLTDAKLGQTNSVCGSATLALNASTTCSRTYTVTAADAAAGTIDNTATANGTGPAPANTAVSDNDTATVNTTTPQASPDTSTGPQNTPQSAPVLSNDTPGVPAVPLAPATLTLLNGGGTPVTTLTVPNQGTYSVDRSNPAEPRLVFTPVPAFVGTATPANYRISDANGNPATSTYTPTVTPVSPTANPDTSTGPQGQPQNVDPLDNDLAGDPGSPLAPATLTLLDPTTNAPVTTLTIPDQGTYSVDRTSPTTPLLVFTPLPAFTGEATPAPYRIADVNGTTAQSTYTPTILPIAPVAEPDTTSGPQGAVQRTTPLDNDTPGDEDTPLVPATLTYLDGAGNPATSITVPNQGTYTIDRADPANPQFVFTPLPAFTGQATPAPYQISDKNGTPAQSTYTPTITPVIPVADPDTTSGPQGIAQRISPLGNDRPGNATTPLVPATLTYLNGAGNPVDTITVPNQGTYTIDRANPADPKFVFTPLPAFVGTATPAPYRIADSNGTTARSTYTPTLNGVTPRATPDISSGEQGEVQRVTPLANDNPGDPAVPLAPDTLTYLNGTTPVDTVTVPNQGTYTIDRTGAAPQFVFTPLPTFTGKATPVPYRISDANGTPADSTYTPSVVGVTPVANPDSSSGRQGKTQSVTPLANDRPGSSTVPLVPGSLTYLNAAGNPVASLTVPNEGTYSIDRSTPSAPKFVFTPEPSFVGEAKPVDYRVADSNGTTAASTYTPTVVGVKPLAEPDETSGPQGKVQRINPVLNDTPGDADTPLVPSTVTYLTAAGTPTDTVTVAGTGKFTIDRSTPTAPVFVFTPEPQFVGQAAPVPYRIADVNGSTARSTYTPRTTPITPTADPDTTSGPQGAVQRTTPLSNDAPGAADAPLVPSTLTYLDGSGNPVTSITVPNQGTYTIDRTTPANPQFVFTPLPAYVGTATPAPYRISDSNGTPARSTYTPTVTGVTPKADLDLSEGPQGAVQRVSPLANDNPGSPTVPLVPGTLTYLDPAGNPVNTLTVPNEGTYTIDTAGTVPQFVFTPLKTFTGTATPVDYRVADSNGTTTASTYTPKVTPVVPTASPDFSSGLPQQPQSAPALVNDRAGSADVPLVPSTLTYLDPAGNPVQTLTVPGQGSYSIDRTNPAAPRWVFVSVAGFEGKATPVPYRISDSNGTSVTSNYTPEVVADAPVATPDETSGPQGIPQSVNPLTNDSPGTGGAPLVPTTLTLLDPTSTPTDRVEVPGQGVYTVNRTTPSTPLIVFTPEKEWVGKASPVPYRVQDQNDQPAQSTYTPNFTPVTPSAQPDDSTGPQGQKQTVTPLANDKPGSSSAPLVPSSLSYLDPNGDPVPTVDVPGEGSYAIDRTGSTPTFVFTPEPTFTGKATPVPYRVLDGNGTPATSTYTPEVTAVTPKALPDATSGPQNKPQSTLPLSNDTPGSSTVPLVPSSLTYLDNGSPVDTIVVPNQGTYTIDKSNPAVPKFVFTPLASFTGTATAAPYRVLDANGTPANSTYTPTLLGVTPRAVTDRTSGPQGIPQSIAPLTDDSAGSSDVPLVPSTLTYLDGSGNPVDTITVDGQGTYTIDKTTPAAPKFVFTPLKTYIGTATPAPYRVLDSNGTPATSTYTPTLVAVVPIANPDTTSGPQGRPQSTPPLANDVPGDDRVPFAPGTLTLLDPSGDPATTVTVPGQGTYSIDKTTPTAPKIVFTPQPDYIGTATPVEYRVEDANGTPVTSTYTPTLVGVAPKANPDTSTGPINKPQSVPPLANDKPGDPNVPLDPTTLTLLTDGTPTDRVAIPDVGVYTIDKSTPSVPLIVFTPAPDYSGTPPPVTYQVEDRNGTPTSSTYSPKVNPGTSAIVVTKRVSDGPVQVEDDTWALEYSIEVGNGGDTPLTGVQVTDDLATTFAKAEGYQVVEITSETLTVNEGFDGTDDTNLLAGTDTLQPGQGGKIVLRLAVGPGTDSGPYRNTAVGTGTGPHGGKVSDKSDSGTLGCNSPCTDIDPKDTHPGAPGDKGTPDDPTPVRFVPPATPTPTPTPSPTTTTTTTPPDNGGGNGGNGGGGPLASTGAAAGLGAAGLAGLVLLAGGFAVLRRNRRH